MRVAHLAVQFRLGNQRGHRVNHQHVNRARTHQRLGNFQCLLAAIRLRNQQVVHIHAQLFGIAGVERVLSVYKRSQPAQPLRFRNHLQSDGRLSRRLRPEDFRNPPAGNATHAQCSVKADGAGGDHRDGQQRLLRAQADNGAFAKLFFDLCEGEFYGFGAVIGNGHGVRLLIRQCKLRQSKPFFP